MHVSEWAHVSSWNSFPFPLVSRLNANQTMQACSLKQILSVTFWRTIDSLSFPECVFYTLLCEDESQVIHSSGLELIVFLCLQLPWMEHLKQGLAGWGNPCLCFQPSWPTLPHVTSTLRYSSLSLAFSSKISLTSLSLSLSLSPYFSFQFPCPNIPWAKGHIHINILVSNAKSFPRKFLPINTPSKCVSVFISLHLWQHWMSTYLNIFVLLGEKGH